MTEVENIELRLGCLELALKTPRPEIGGIGQMQMGGPRYERVDYVAIAKTYEAYVLAKEPADVAVEKVKKFIKEFGESGWEA